MHDGPHFDFIHNRCNDLSDPEIREAEERFARLLDILAEIAAEEGSRAPSKFDSNGGCGQTSRRNVECAVENHGSTQGSFDF